MDAQDPTLYYYPVCMADTDANGVVYHARYVEMVERARSRLMNLAGFTFARLAHEYQVMLIVHRIEAAYYAPALLDDQLVLKTRLTKCLSSRTVWTTDVRRDRQAIAAVTTEIVTLHTVTRELMRHPPDFLAGLTSFLEPVAAAGVR